MPRQAKISIPHPVPETVSDRKSRFLFFILAWGRRSKTLNRNFTTVGTSAERPDYIPENIFYRLAP